MYEKVSFRTIVAISIFFLYILFSIAVFSFVNNFYMRGTKQKLSDENYYSSKVCKDIIEQEKLKLLMNSNQIAKDDVVYHALKSNIYIGTDKWVEENGFLKTPKIEMNKMRYTMLANARNKTDGVEIEIFKYENQQLNMVGSTLGMIANKEIADNGTEKYLLDSIGQTLPRATELSFIEKKANKFYLKTISPVGLNARWVPYMKAYAENIPGLIVFRKVLDGLFLESLKKVLNKEIILVEKNIIRDSTIYSKTERLREIKIDFTPDYKNEFFRRNILIEGKLYEFTFFNIVNYSGENIGYIGTGYDKKEVVTIYEKGIKKFIIYEIIFSIIIFIFLYMILNILFKPIILILKTIKSIRDGNYGRKINIKTWKELQLIVDSINKLSEAVENREKEMKTLNRKLEENNTNLQKAQEEVVYRLSNATKYKDPETQNHIIRVGLYSALIGKYLGWNSDEIELIKLAAPMHDIGKVGIPDGILLKPGKLDDYEWKIMKLHSEYGYNILNGSDSNLLKTAASIALEHHERWNGTGYPNGKKEEEISIYGRITAIADVFDALTSKRKYKNAWSFEDAIELIKNEKGQHFDPQITDIFLEHIEEMIEIKTKYKDEE